MWSMTDPSLLPSNLENVADTPTRIGAGLEAQLAGCRKPK